MRVLRTAARSSSDYNYSALDPSSSFAECGSVNPREERTGSASGSNIAENDRPVLYLVQKTQEAELVIDERLEIPDLSVAPATAAWIGHLGLVARIALRIDDQQVHPSASDQIAVRLSGRRPCIYRLQDRLMIDYRVASLGDDEWATAARFALSTVVALQLPEVTHTSVELLRVTSSATSV